MINLQQYSYKRPFRCYWEGGGIKGGSEFWYFCSFSSFHRGEGGGGGEGAGGRSSFSFCTYLFLEYHSCFDLMNSDSGRWICFLYEEFFFFFLYFCNIFEACFATFLLAYFMSKREHFKNKEKIFFISLRKLFSFLR